MGLAEETLNRLFGAFAQADRSLDRSRGGLGLGLALVKGLVELHGGEVQAHSEGLGTGTEILIRLPLTAGPVPIAPRRPVATNGSTGSGRRVLVIEDSRDVAEST